MVAEDTPADEAGIAAPATGVDWTRKLVRQYPFLPRDLRQTMVQLLQLLHQQQRASQQHSSPYLQLLSQAQSPGQQTTQNPTQTCPTITELLATSVTLPVWHHRSHIASLFLPTHNFIATLDSFLKTRMLSVAPATVSKDLSAIKWLCQHNLLPQQHIPLLNELQRALARQPHTVLRALPLSPQMFKHLILLATSRHLTQAALALRVAWLTASRVGDLDCLRGKDIYRTPTGLLVVFTTTKQKQEVQAQRADHYVPLPFTPDLSPLLHFPPETHIFTSSTLAQAEHLLESLKPPLSEIQLWTSRDPRGAIRDHYTMHSIKRGAAWVLWTQVALHKLSLPQLLHALKHRTTETSLAYCPEPALIPPSFNAELTASILLQAPYTETEP